MEKSLQYQDRKLSYVVRGEGEPVMLVHGFGEDRQIWDLQVDQLAKRFRLILPDLPGSGASELNEDVSMENMAAALNVIADSEKLDNFVMLGHSMGGYVTLAYVAANADRLKAFGLVHSTAYADTEEKKATRRKGIEFIKKHGTREFLETTDPNLFSDRTKKENPGLVKQLIEKYSGLDPSSLVAYYEAMIARPDRTAVLQEFGRPVLFLAGEHDTAIPLEQVKQQSGLALVSYLHILEHSGHMGMWEEPNQFGFVLEDFIKNNVL